MSIDSEIEARFAYENLAKTHALCDRVAADTTGHPETRADEVESIQAMIRKVERQLLSYLICKYASAPAPSEINPAEVAA